MQKTKPVSVCHYAVMTFAYCGEAVLIFITKPETLEFFYAFLVLMWTDIS